MTRERERGGKEKIKKNRRQRERKARKRDIYKESSRMIRHKTDNSGTIELNKDRKEIAREKKRKIESKREKNRERESERDRERGYRKVIAVEL